MMADEPQGKIPEEHEDKNRQDNGNGTITRRRTTVKNDTAFANVSLLLDILYTL
jgi:hypothetical protein